MTEYATLHYSQKGLICEEHFELKPKHAPALREILKSNTRRMQTSLFRNAFVKAGAVPTNKYNEQKQLIAPAKRYFTEPNDHQQDWEWHFAKNGNTSNGPAGIPAHLYFTLGSNTVAFGKQATIKGQKSETVKAFDKIMLDEIYRIQECLAREREDILARIGPIEKQSQVDEKPDSLIAGL